METGTGGGNKKSRNQEIKKKKEEIKMERGTVKVVALTSSGDSNVRGSLHFLRGPNGITHVKGGISGLKPGLHGFHIHTFGTPPMAASLLVNGIFVLVVKYYWSLNLIIV
ncbi:hypothetical protein QYF36_006151 [Acer negundo]|nr:hypothetical protein QYF36_006151 [Acer negundo]